MSPAHLQISGSDGATPDFARKLFDEQGVTQAAAAGEEQLPRPCATPTSAWRKREQARAPEAAPGELEKFFVPKVRRKLGQRLPAGGVSSNEASLEGTWSYSSGGESRRFRLEATDDGRLRFLEGHVRGVLLADGSELHARLYDDSIKEIGQICLRKEPESGLLVSKFKAIGAADFAPEIHATKVDADGSLAHAGAKHPGIDLRDLTGEWAYGDGAHHYRITFTEDNTLQYAEGDVNGLLLQEGAWMQATLFRGRRDMGSVRVRPNYGRGDLESQFCAPSSTAWGGVTLARKVDGAAIGAPEVPAGLASRARPGLMAEPPLSNEQEALLARVLERDENVFFTGAAGTGKSRTLRELIRRRPEKSCFVTALTGLAATQLPRGTTLHSFAGVGLAKGTKEECLERANANPKAKRNWLMAKLLIVDEASMMSKALFDKLEFVARGVRDCAQPFGGIVLCFCGDFFQLPPVARGAGEDAQLCFESDRWRECFTPAGDDRAPQPENCFALTRVFRQRDGDLLRLLSEVRNNELTPWGLQVLKNLSRPLAAEEIEPTRLFPTNSAVDGVNAQRLAALPGGEGRESFLEANDKFPENFHMTEQAIENLLSYPRGLQLKVGAQVMLLRNMSANLVNGSRGVVQAFEKRSDGDLLPVVQFRSGELVVVERETENKELASGQKLSRHMVPLRLSWAMTIHKSQGMSIDFLEVDLQNVFEAGQAYVALSRARTMEGLRVLSFDPRKFWTSPRVAEFYKTRVRPVLTNS